MQPDTRRKLDHVPGLLVEEFPGLPRDAAMQTVESVSRDVLARATIEDFVPVLVHRYARERILESGRALRGEHGHLPVSAASGGAEAQ